MFFKKKPDKKDLRIRELETSLELMTNLYAMTVSIAQIMNISPKLIKEHVGNQKAIVEYLKLVNGGLE